MMNTDMIEKIRARCAEVGDCWIWQQATSATGYPIIRLNRTCQLVRRVVAAAMGLALAPRQPVVTTCGERLCCNPEHIKPTTTKAVARAAAKRGAYSTHQRAAAIARARRRGGLKLTDAQVQEILTSTEPGPVIAARMGISRSYPNHIRRGAARRDYSNPRAGLGAR